MSVALPTPGAIVFDFDGTIGDTRGLILSCFLATYRELELPAPSEEAIAATIGLRLERAFANLSDLDDAASLAAANSYRRIFHARDHAAVAPIRGVPEVVRRCHGAGLPIAVGSSRGHDTLDPMLKGLGLFELFGLVLDHGDAGAEKPDPAMLQVVARRFGVAPSQLIMIGDTTFDVEMGNNAGAFSVGVTWGNHTREQLLGANPSLIAESPEELTSFLGLDAPVSRFP